MEEMMILIDKKLPYAEIEAKLQHQIKKEEVSTEEYIARLEQKEKDGIYVQNEIIGLTDEIAELERRVYEDGISEEEMEFLSQELSNRYAELEDYQNVNSLRFNLDIFKADVLEGLHEKLNNIVFVYDMPKLGISDDTWKYIEYVANEYNKNHNKAKISLKMLSETATLSDKVPSIMTAEELKKITEFIIQSSAVLLRIA